jgi:DNA polymerase (family 10)
MNSQLAAIFREMALLLEMKAIPFKPRAYEKGAQALESLGQGVEDIYKKGGKKALLEIPGIGMAMADKIEEYIRTGQVKAHQELKKKVPVNLEDLSSIDGIGPKMILKLYKKLKIKDREQLEEALKSGKLRNIKGLGEKTEQNILKNIGFLKKSAGRLPLFRILPLARQMLDSIRELPSVEQAELAGSLRRMQETVGDVDVLVTSDKPDEVMNFFISMPQVVEVVAKGSTKSSVRLSVGIDADLRVVPSESFGAALQYFSGDKFHNVALRQLAIRKGYKLNEYGLYKGDELVAGETEEEIYKKLGLDYVEPELRTNHGEIDLASAQSLPELITYADIKGDLHTHSDWTDGKYPIEKMAEMAKEFGHEYICISDHTKTLAMTNGLNEERLLEQMAEIDCIQKEVPGIKILKGAEVNILKDGTLDIEDEVLAKLDVCGAAVHSHFNMTEEEMTARIIRAMENPNVDIIYHPTGRIINKRDAYPLDIDAVIAAAKRTGTMLEIDGYPDRLDLKDEHLRKCIAAGVKFSIDTDAHSYNHFAFMEYGVSQARRAGATKDDVINTRSWKELLKLLK